MMTRKAPFLLLAMTSGTFAACASAADDTDGAVSKLETPPEVRIVERGDGWVRAVVKGAGQDLDTNSVTYNESEVVIATSSLAMRNAPVPEFVKDDATGNVNQQGIRPLRAGDMGGMENHATRVVHLGRAREIEAKHQDALQEMSRGRKGGGLQIQGLGGSTLRPLGFGEGGYDKTFSKRLDLDARSFGKDLDVLDLGVFAKANQDNPLKLKSGLSLEGKASSKMYADVTAHISTFLGVPYSADILNYNLIGKFAAEGTLGVNVKLEKAFSFDTDVADIPLGTTVVWAGPIPIVIGGSVPIRFGVDVDLSIAANLRTDLAITGDVDMRCDAQGCKGKRKVSWSVGREGLTYGVEGRAKIAPWISAGVRGEVYWGLVSAELGLKATAKADVWGFYGNACGDRDGEGGPETVSALTADVSLPLELQVGATGLWGLLGEGNPKTFAKLAEPHIGFWKLTKSDALTPIFYRQSFAGDAPNTLRMVLAVPPCWPYDEKITHLVNWGDGTTTSVDVHKGQRDDKDAQRPFTVTHTFSRAVDAGIIAGVSAEAAQDERGRKLAASKVASEPTGTDEGKAFWQGSIDVDDTPGTWACSASQGQVFSSLEACREGGVGSGSAVPAFPRAQGSGCGIREQGRDRTVDSEEVCVPFRPESVTGLYQRVKSTCFCVLPAPTLHFACGDGETESLESTQSCESEVSRDAGVTLPSTGDVCTGDAVKKTVRCEVRPCDPNVRMCARGPGNRDAVLVKTVRSCSCL